MQPEEFAELLRTELPRLLREHPEVRHEIWGVFLEAFPSRQEFTTLLEELRAFREDADRRFEELRLDMDRRFAAMEQRFEAMDRRFEELRLEMDRHFAAMEQRFEAMDRRFEAVDQRFEAMLAEMRETREQAERRSRELELHLSALGLRVGRGLEQVIREVVEEFSGQTFTTAERLVLSDTAGVVFGVQGAQIEFDLYAANGAAYLVEVKSHVKPGDVLTFHRQAEFAVQTLRRPCTRLIIALSMEAQAERLMQRLGIQYRVRTRVE